LGLGFLVVDVMIGVLHLFDDVISWSNELILWLKALLDSQAIIQVFKALDRLFSIFGAKLMAKNLKYFRNSPCD